MYEPNSLTLTGDHLEDTLTRLAARYCFLESGFISGAEITDQSLADFEQVALALILLKREHPELFLGDENMFN